MSVGIFTLKVGLVTTVAGTAVATPILLRNRRSLVTEVVQSAEVNNVSLGTSTEASTIPESTSTELERADRSSESEPRIEEQQRAGDSDSGFLASTSESSSSSHVSTGEEVSQRVSDDTSESDSEQVTRNTESEEVRVTSPENTEDLSRTGSSISSQESVTPETSSSPSAVKKAEFGKKCFIVPAEIKDTNSSVQLLTCYDERKLRKEVDEDQPEYESVFHIYDPSQPKNPIEIKGSLWWNPESQQLVAKLASNSETTHTFTAEGKHWGGISPSKTPVNLLERDECAIYEVTLNDSTDSSTHWLACGGDVGEFTKEDPKGIPLTNWELKRR